MIYRIIFILAACYNLTFGIWICVSPESLFGLANTDVPLSEGWSKILGVMIAGFSPIYVYAAIRIKQARTVIMLGLLSKIAPTFIVLFCIYYAGWSFELFKLIFFNDIIWWMPFYLFLRNRNWD